MSKGEVEKACRVSWEEAPQHKGKWHPHSAEAASRSWVRACLGRASDLCTLESAESAWRM